jgi:hypothetical protein
LMGFAIFLTLASAAFAVDAKTTTTTIGEL